MPLLCETEAKTKSFVMKLFAHFLVVGTVVFGGDIYFNNALETQALINKSGRAVTTGVRLQAYHFSTFIDRKVEVLLPTD